MNAKNVQSSNPRDHVQNIEDMLQQVIAHVREDVVKVHDPRAQALFETTAEVLQGLKNAYQHYAAQSEQAWRQD